MHLVTWSTYNDKDDIWDEPARYGSLAYDDACSCSSSSSST